MRRAAVPAAVMCLATRFRLAAATLEAAAPWAATIQAGDYLLIHPPKLPSHLYIMPDSLYCTTLGSRDVLRQPTLGCYQPHRQQQPLGHQ